MYSISKNEGYLLVKFIDDFDFPMIQAAIHHETMMGEYADMNDVWLIGDNHADIRLGEIDLMVREFQCRCPRDTNRTKTAIVINEGLSGAKIELWVKALQNHVTFEVKIFRTLDDAEQWLGATKSRVA